MNMDDSDLSRLLADPKQFSFFFQALVDTHSGRLYKIAYSITRNQSSAEDIVQETFLRAYRALKKYSSEEIVSMKLGAWLNTIAYNRSLDHQRREKRQLYSVSIDLPEGKALAEETDQGWTSSPEIEVVDKESQDELYTYIDQLPPSFRVVLLLRCKSELSYPEIAEILNQPYDTVKSNARRGMLMLRKMTASKKIFNKE